MTIFGFALAAILTLQGASIKTLDMTTGSGAEAVAGDRVTIEYTGNLLDGKVFDYSAGKAPFSFELGAGKVIKGFDQGVLGMKAGGRRVISIPPELGYGDKDLKEIPPNSTLIFDIKLLMIEKKGMTQELKIEELAPGNGDASKTGNKVTIKYKGMFLNGSVFDQGEFPFTLGEGKVIKGFDQGVTGMKVGGKRKVTIPPALGYGERGTPGGPIPPNATLVFEIELTKIG